MNKSKLITELCPPIDQTLLDLLIDEFLSLENRFILRDWEPATLDGGQFSEIFSRIIYAIDSSNLNRTKGVNDCLKYIEDPTNSNTHNFPNRKSSLHMSRVLRFTYKFRSDRGAVHINPDYTANQLDSKLMIESVRWLFSELLRIFWSGDDKEIEKLIKNIIEFDLPVVGKYEERLLVQRTDCSTDEEILILLHYSGDDGLNRRELGKYVHKAPSTITNSLSSLSSSNKRLVVKKSNGNYRLTELGNKFVFDNLPEKLKI